MCRSRRRLVRLLLELRCICLSLVSLRLCLICMRWVLVWSVLDISWLLFRLIRMVRGSMSTCLRLLIRLVLLFRVVMLILRNILLTVCLRVVWELRVRVALSCRFTRWYFVGSLIVLRRLLFGGRLLIIRLRILFILLLRLIIMFVIIRSRRRRFSRRLVMVWMLILRVRLFVILRRRCRILILIWIALLRFVLRLSRLLVLV